MTSFNCPRATSSLFVIANRIGNTRSPLYISERNGDLYFTPRWGLQIVTSLYGLVRLSKFYGIVDSSFTYLRTPSLLTHPRWRCSTRRRLGYVLDHVELKQYACTPRHLTIALWTTATTTHTLSASLIACVDILWNTHTHNPSCFSTLLRSMAETESSEGPPHCHYKDIMFSVQDDTTFGLRFCNITMLHGGHQQNHSCLAAVVRLHRPEKATALWDVVYLRYPAYLDWCWSKLNKLHKKLSSKCYLSIFLENQMWLLFKIKWTP